jgi:hypothetical protein
MRKEHREAGGRAPSGRQLTLDAQIEKMINVLDLRAEHFALLLFVRSDEVPERGLVAVGQRDGPKLGMATLRKTACFLG